MRTGGIDRWWWWGGLASAGDANNYEPRLMPIDADAAVELRGILANVLNN